MSSLKKLTKELRQEVVSYLFPFPPISKNLAFRLAMVISLKLGFVVTSSSSAVALNLKLFLRVFAPIFMHLLFPIQCNQYLRQIQCAQNSFSRNMRITIRTMCKNMTASTMSL